MSKKHVVEYYESKPEWLGTSRWEEEYETEEDALFAVEKCNEAFLNRENALHWFKATYKGEKQ